MIRKKVTMPNGDRPWISGETEAEVDARIEAIRRMRREVDTGAALPAQINRLAAQVASARMTLHDAWRGYLPTVPPRSQKIAKSDWAQRLEPWFGKLTIHDLTPDRLGAWEQDLIARGYADETVINTWFRIKSLYRWIGRRCPEPPWGVGQEAWKPRTRLPPISKRPMKREACRTIEELLALVRAAQREDERCWAHGRFGDLAARVITAALCGLRQGEVAALGWDDLHLGDPPVLTVEHQCCDAWQLQHPGWERPSDKPKGGNARKVVMHSAVVGFLLQQREQVKSRGWYRDNGPVFPSPGGGWRTHSRCIRQDVFTRICTDAGLPNLKKWTPHSLKHSFATLELVASGGDLRTTQERTGHSSIEMLQHYLHSIDRGLPTSAIGDLNVEAARAPDTPPPQLPVVAGMLCAAASQRIEASRRIEATRNAAKAAQRTEWNRRWKQGKRVVFDLGELAADHVRQVRAGQRARRDHPPEVTGYADRCYSRAYNSHKRSGDDEETAAKHGRMARRALLASWAKVVKGTEERLGPVGSEQLMQSGPAQPSDQHPAGSADQGTGTGSARARRARRSHAAGDAAATQV